jgi:hypothetical protein
LLSDISTHPTIRARRECKGRWNVVSGDERDKGRSRREDER